MIYLRSPRTAATLTTLLALSGLLALPAASAQDDPPARAVAALAPALAVGKVPAIAWTATDSTGDRVRAAIPTEMPGRALGPGGPGNDGAPTLAAIGDGFIVAASRTTRGAGRLWYQQWRNGRWSEPGSIEPARRDNHHPAATSGAGSLWLVWVGGNGDRLDEDLYAARWTGSRWSAPELLPSAPGSPMAPAIALDDRGRPIVVWAAMDGDDAEIWATRRAGGEWTAAAAVSHNDVHDILPHVAFVDSRWVVAWSSRHANGYVPVAATGSRNAARWRNPQPLSASPGSSPKVFAARNGAGVIWTSSDLESDTTVLRAATLGPRGWRRERIVTTASSPRMGAAAGPGRGELAIGWTERSAPAAASVTESLGSTDSTDGADFDVQPLRDRELTQRRRFNSRSVTFPGTYRGFGDSITEGTVRFDGVVEETDGYPVPLAEMISDLLGTAVAVENRGLGGEFTAEGLGRLAGLMTFPTEFTLLMHGANDIANLFDPVVTADNLHAMVVMVIGAGSIPAISTVTPRTDGFDRRVDETNSEMLARVSTEPAILVDNHAAFVGRGDLYSDTLHPNPEGYFVMAQVWFRALRPVLQQLLQERDTNADQDRDLRTLLSPRRPIR